jgi:hypothetical protein
MRIFRPAHRLALTLILTVLLGACGGGNGSGGTAAAPGAGDGASADPNVPTMPILPILPILPSEPSEPSVPTIVEVNADNGAEQFVKSLPEQFDVGNVLRIAGAGAGGWKVTQTGRQEIKVESLIGKTWKTQSISSDFWAVSASADGRVMAAVGGYGNIYISTDSGASWTPYQVNGEDRWWRSVSVSPDGRKVVVGVWEGSIYVGTPDDGSWKWTDMSPKTNETGDWFSIALSHDASTIVAGDWGRDIYIWTNGKWTSGGLKQGWNAVAVSANGSKAVAVGEDLVSGGGAFYVWDKNQNDGLWTIPASVPQGTYPWLSVACSLDCSKLVVAEGRGGDIQTFTEGNWVRTTAGQQHWYSVDSSADATRLVAVAHNGQIQFSVKGGDTWTAAEEPGTKIWYSVACSADCTKMVAVVERGEIWTSIAGTTPGAQGYISGGPLDIIDLEYLGNDVWRLVNPSDSLTIQ